MLGKEAADCPFIQHLPMVYIAQINGSRKWFKKTREEKVINKLWFKFAATAVIFALAGASFVLFGMRSEQLLVVAVALVLVISVWWKWVDIDGNEYR